MSSFFFFVTAGVLTMLCAWLEWRQIKSRHRINDAFFNALLALLLLFTLIGLMMQHPITEKGLSFHLSSTVAFCTLLVQAIYLLGRIRHGVRGLGLFLLPATALPLLMIPLLPDHITAQVHTSSLLETSHLLISLLAYSILTLATLHALMHIQLDYVLKKKKFISIMQALPSLMEIEAHMFAQVRWAAWLLALGILTGLSWQWVTLAHFEILSHKVLLATFSWGVLVSLLFMRKRGGWHGRRAGMIVVSAYTLLLLAYFGVRLIQSWT
ncbi:MAG: cytochrome c biogenesis protein CcsA [Mariprofundaceae bacterium]